MTSGNGTPGTESSPAPRAANAPPRFFGHFAGIMLDANMVDFADPAFGGRGPAAAGGAISLQSLEDVLAERLQELGGEVRYGAEVTGFQADEDGVTVHAGDAVLRAGWLVGCDGGRSTVRKLAGFEFSGNRSGNNRLFCDGRDCRP